MEYILIALQTFTSLGEYHSKQECESAIKQIYIAQLGPMVKINDSINAAIDMKLKYQTQFTCISK